MRRGWLELATSTLDGRPLLDERGDVTREILRADAFGGGADDDAVPRGLDVVNDLAQSAALAVREALGDADGRGVRHEHGEASGQRHLLGEAGALVRQWRSS